VSAGVAVKMRTESGRMLEDLKGILLKEKKFQYLRESLREILEMQDENYLGVENWK
jgi:hypothetical protein